MKLFRKEEGFTLVELMVVVLIIGILVAVAIPVFNAASASARERTCQANQRSLEGAVQQYLAADPSNVIADIADGADADLIPSYIKDAPICPTDATKALAYDIDGTGKATCPSTPAHAYFGN